MATSLTMGQAFRWRPLGDGWYSGVLKRRLVHLRQTPDGIEYRVGGPSGEIADVDLNQSQGGMCICRKSGTGLGVSQEGFGP